MVKKDIKAEEKVYNFLLDHPGEKFYPLQIARKTKLSNSTVYDILKRGVDKGFLKKEKLGNLKLHFVNQLKPAVKQAKIDRTLQKLNPLIKELKEWSKKIILFGSAAVGENTKGSDIDLFVLSNEKNQVYKLFSQSKLRGDRVKLVVKNILEWRELKEKDRFFHNQINKGKVLWDQNEAI